MRAFTHFVNDETAYLTVQLDAEQYKNLRVYMHAQDGELVHFPRSVRMNSRSRGWYRLTASNDYDAINKLRCALGIIRSWFYAYRKEQQKLQRLNLVKNDPSTRVIAYHSDSGNFETIQQRTPSRPPSQEKLQALQRKFAHRHV